MKLYFKYISIEFECIIWYMTNQMTDIRDSA